MIRDIDKTASAAPSAEKVGASNSLEFRLERIKRFSNRSLDFLKRLYDRRSIAELYLQREVCLHVHFLTRHGIACARYHTGKIEESKPVSGGVDNELEASLIVMQSPVLVWIGEVAESLRPIASVVRLQSLDCCQMSGIEAFELFLLPKREALLSVFDNELSAINDLSRVQDGKFVNQVIKRSPEIVADLPYQNGKDEWNAKVLVRADLDFAWSIRIEIPRNRIVLRLPELIDSSYKLTKVFACPSYAGDSPVQRAVWRRSDHFGCEKF